MLIMITIMIIIIMYSVIFIGPTSELEVNPIAEDAT